MEAEREKHEAQMKLLREEREQAHQEEKNENDIVNQTLVELFKLQFFHSNQVKSNLF